MGDGRATLRLTRYLDAPVTEVWAALTEPDSISRWLARPGAVELAEGGPFELHTAAGAATRIHGRVRAVEPERVLELDWHPVGQEPSVVRFELTPAGPGTTLVLDHRRLDERVCMAYARTWERRLDDLEASVAAVETRR